MAANRCPKGTDCSNHDEHERPTMKRHTSIMLAGLVIALALSGCSAQTPAAVPGSPGNSASGDGSAAQRLAPGLYDQGDGTVLGYGTLEWRDADGGFWAVIDGTRAPGDASQVAAVVAGVSKDDPAFTKLAGKSVQIDGTRVKGTSARHAGPEITVTLITEVSDTPAPAE